MIVKDVIDVDYINYKYPSMLIAMPRCTFKCDVCNGKQVCQNSALAQQPDIIIDTEKLIKRYLKSSAKAVVFGGLEPFDTFDDLLLFIDKLRRQHHCDDMIVIYSGYTKEEIQNQINILKQYNKIIIKFNRYIDNLPSRKDDVLGVTLASNNQYAEQIS